MATKAATKLTNAMKNPADNKVATTAKLMIATKYRLICESNVASSKLELATVGAGETMLSRWADRFLRRNGRRPTASQRSIV
jgi:hypothetical protein